MTAPASPARSSASNSRDHRPCAPSPGPGAAPPSDLPSSGQRRPLGNAPVEAPVEPLHLLAARALIAFRALRRAEARLARDQGACLLRLLDRRDHLRAGFARFTDFAREVLQQAPRTTKRRLALARTLAACPVLERAFTGHRLTACQVLALRPLAGHPALPFWIELAGTIPVRDLHRDVRAEVSRLEAEAADPSGAGTGDTLDGNARARTGAPRTEPDPEEAPGVRVTFAAPLPAAVAWDQALDMARRVLGWDAPPYLCVEAILAEATGDLAAHFPPGALADETAGHTAAHPRHASPPRSATATRTANAPSPTEVESNAKRSPLSTPRGPFPSRVPRPAPGSRRRLRSTVARVERELRRVPAQTLAAGAADAGGDPRGLIRRARSLGRLERPLRLLQARLLFALLQADAVWALGYPSLAAFAEEGLGLAPRTARRLLAQAFLLDDHPALARAFTRGHIGAGQAFLVHRVALERTLPAFLHRARGVTHLALDREVRFLERLREILPTVASRFRGPFPLPGLEAALVRALEDRGWDPETVHARLRDRRIEPPAENTPVMSQDPARNPTVLRRLEALLEFVVLADAEHDARAAATGKDDPPEPDDPTEVPEPIARPALAPDPRVTTVTFWAPASLHRHWDACLAAIRARCGPIPTWAAATNLAGLAVRQWQHTDPARKPTTATRVLRRDDYRCQAPGCSARRRLEVHHIRFRSRSGSDAPKNLLTLCATHHRHVVHSGWLRVAGTAPGGLVWDK